MKYSIILLFSAVLVLLSACKSKEPDPYKDARVPQKKENRSSWEKFQKELKKRRAERRPTRGDINHFHNQDLQVFPGRTGTRSKKLYEKDDSIFSLW